MAEHTHTPARAIPRGLILVCAIFGGLHGVSARGQHTDETAGQMLRLRAFGAYTYVRPNYDGSARNQGITLGGEIDGFRFLPRTEVGLDARYTYSAGQIISQTFYGGGPRVSVNFAKFRPYGDFLYGNGVGHFNRSSDSSYKSDNTAVSAYGGGFDYQVTRTWAVRVDAQQQRWRFSVHQQPFHPTVVSVGLSYQFHFHSRTGPDL